MLKVALFSVREDSLKDSIAKDGSSFVLTHAAFLWGKSQTAGIIRLKLHFVIISSDSAANQDDYFFRFYFSISQFLFDRDGTSPIEMFQNSFPKA